MSKTTKSIVTLPTKQQLARRNFLFNAGSAMISIPVVTLIACNSAPTQNAIITKQSDDASTSTSTTTDTATSTDTAASTTPDTASTGTTSTEAGTATGTVSTEVIAAGTDATAWATGGTLAMKGNYADPFTEGLGSTCTVYKSSTLGPCYAKTVTRKDMTEGQAGLPTRFAILIVDVNCKPVANATVDIWHCSPAGLYSGSDASNMCTANNAAAKAARWFRAVQITDANGRVDFDTCFPGWYASRTVHVHFTISVGGTAYLTSQLFFEDTLNNEIISSQVLYKERGAKDTKNASDKVISESSLNNYYFNTKKMADGALMAWKTIVIKG